MLNVGSYTHLLYGFDATATGELNQSFIHSAHTESVTAVASAGHLFASGSNDTSIWIYNTRTRKEVGTLSRHTHAITALLFWKTKHMLSASGDGTICVWRVQDWECLLQLQAHKKGVRSMSLHPTGRMIISIGVGTKKAKLWNLLTGKVAVVFMLGKAAENTHSVALRDGEFAPHLGRDFRDVPIQVKWSPDGNYFAVSWATQVDVYSAADSTKSALFSFGVSDRVSSFAWAASDCVAVGTERGNVFWYRTMEGAPVLRASAPLGSRVKDLERFSDDLLAGISSAGDVVMWSNTSGAEVSKVSVDDRLICLSLVSPVAIAASNAKQIKQSDGARRSTKEKQRQHKGQKRDAAPVNDREAARDASASKKARTKSALAAPSPQQPQKKKSGAGKLKGAQAQLKKRR